MSRTPDDFWSVRLPASVKDEVEAIARQENRPPPDQVRHVIQRWLTQRRIAASKPSNNTA